MAHERVGKNVDLDSLYDKYIDDLYGYARNSCLDEEMAKDAIHDIFCRIYAKPAILEGVSDVRLYLLRSLRNRITDIYRSRRGISMEPDALAEAVPFQIRFTAEDQLIQSEEQRLAEEKVNKMIGVLTNRQREIIYLRYTHGYSYSEISKLMNISVPACHKLMSAAIARLRLTSGISSVLAVIAALQKLAN